jgi:cell wall-associated NlpC family hydrolase
MRDALKAAARGALVAGLGLALAACLQRTTTPEPPNAGVILTPPAGSGAVADPVRSRIVFTALQMVGAPYRFGGESPDGFDCSGLVHFAYRSAGVSVPRTSRDQLKASTPVALTDAVAGDLLFFRSEDFSHVGIYLGEGRFVHAPSTGRSVSLASFGEAYYRRNFLRAGRMPEVARVAASCGRGASPDC